MARVLELLAVHALLACAYLPDLDRVTFHPDESTWISGSRRLEAFVSASFASPVWQPGYESLDHPPLTFYVIGVARRLAGFKAEHLNTTWDYSRDHQSNIRAGAYPSPRLLWWSRLPMAILAVLSGVLLFMILRSHSGWLAAWAGVAMFGISPYLHQNLRRAMAESTLLFFSLLTVALVASTIRRSRGAEDLCGARPERRRWRRLGMLLATALGGGLAAAAKLPGAGATATGVILTALCCRISIVPPVPWVKTLRRALAFAGLAFATFVAVNPTLYRNPLLHPLRMLNHRRLVIQGQAREYPDHALVGIRAHLRVVPERILSTYAPMASPVLPPVYGLLVACGLFSLGRSAWRWSRRAQSDGSGAAILVAAACLAGPALATPLDWDRYYMFPEVFAMILAAIGASWILSGAARAVGQRLTAG